MPPHQKKNPNRPQGQNAPKPDAGHKIQMLPAAPAPAPRPAPRSGGSAGIIQEVETVDRGLAAAIASKKETFQAMQERLERARALENRLACLISERAFPCKGADRFTEIYRDLHAQLSETIRAAERGFELRVAVRNTQCEALRGEIDALVLRDIAWLRSARAGLEDRCERLRHGDILPSDTFEFNQCLPLLMLSAPAYASPDGKVQFAPAEVLLGSEPPAGPRRDAAGLARAVDAEAKREKPNKGKSVTPTPNPKSKSKTPKQSRISTDPPKHKEIPAADGEIKSVAFPDRWVRDEQGSDPYKTFVFKEIPLVLMAGGPAVQAAITPGAPEFRYSVSPGAGLLVVSDRFSPFYSIANEFLSAYPTAECSLAGSAPAPSAGVRRYRMFVVDESAQEDEAGRWLALSAVSASPAYFAWCTDNKSQSSTAADIGNVLAGFAEIVVSLTPEGGTTATVLYAAARSFAVSTRVYEAAGQAFSDNCATAIRLTPDDTTVANDLWSLSAVSAGYTRAGLAASGPLLVKPLCKPRACVGVPEAEAFVRAIGARSLLASLARAAQVDDSRGVAPRTAREIAGAATAHRGPVVAVGLSRFYADTRAGTALTGSVVHSGPGTPARVVGVRPAPARPGAGPRVRRHAGTADTAEVFRAEVLPVGAKPPGLNVHDLTDALVLTAFGSDASARVYHKVEVEAAAPSAPAWMVTVHSVRVSDSAVAFFRFVRGVLGASTDYVRFNVPGLPRVDGDTEAAESAMMGEIVSAVSGSFEKTAQALFAKTRADQAAAGVESGPSFWFEFLRKSGQLGALTLPSLIDSARHRSPRAAVFLRSALDVFTQMSANADGVPVILAVEAARHTAPRAAALE